jgi:hypothetical protein
MRKCLSVMRKVLGSKPFDVPTAVRVETAVFWDVAPCDLVKSDVESLMISLC